MKDISVKFLSKNLDEMVRMEAYARHMPLTHGEKVNLAVAAELRAQRARIGVSYDALAAGTGLSKSAVFKYLKGTRSIPVPALYALCSVLRIEVEYVFMLAVKAAEDS